ncbi:MAG: hypothetical protein QF824_02055 [Candidatus Woesearchaeota archaeon]|nr:hypothetical protein [Candidatus Woesearchaeota archaeon]
MKKRGGFQLSMNFIVIIVISIAILILSISFISKIMSASRTQVAEADAASSQEIARLLNSGQAVAVSPTNIDGSGVVVLGIMNDGSVDDAGFDNNFGFRVTYDDCDGGCGSGSPGTWVSRSGADEDVYLIPEFESDEFLISVNPESGAPEGTYVFNVDVRKDNKRPGNEEIIYDDLDKDEKYKSLLKFYVKI